MTLQRRKHWLPPQQRRLFDEIDRYYRVTGEPASAAYLARRLNRARQTVAEQIAVLHRKGFVRAPQPPAAPVSAPVEMRSTAENAGLTT